MGNIYIVTVNSGGQWESITDFHSAYDEGGLRSFVKQVKTKYPTTKFKNDGLGGLLAWLPTGKHITIAKVGINKPFKLT